MISTGDGTCKMVGLCLVIGRASCKWQLAVQVKAAAGGSCSVEAFVHAQHLYAAVILFYLVVH